MMLFICDQMVFFYMFRRYFDVKFHTFVKLNHFCFISDYFKVVPRRKEDALTALDFVFRSPGLTERLNPAGLSGRLCLCSASLRPSSCCLPPPPPMSFSLFGSHEGSSSHQVLFFMNVHNFIFSFTPAAMKAGNQEEKEIKRGMTSSFQSVIIKLQNDH